MKRPLRDRAVRANSALAVAGIDLLRMRSSLHWARFIHDRKKFAAAGGQIDELLPITADMGEHAGRLDAHYFTQDLLVARRVYEASPKRHVDVGSRLDGFVAHVAAFRTIDVIDIRPAPAQLDQNIRFIQADMMSASSSLTNCTDSASSLHALEHFGLGRYGDPIDPIGHLKGFQNLEGLVSAGGRFYVSVPVGRPRTVFNAHRVFDPTAVPEWTKDRSRLTHFDFIDDAGKLHLDQNPDDAASCEYGCGIFTFQKD
jgi:hypothetical protein